MPSTQLNDSLRSKYVANSVDTMSPGRVVVALYDRFLLDLERAQCAIVAKDLAGAHESLIHAQDIVTELHNALDLQRWPGGRRLADVYDFVYNELVAANVEKSARRISTCRELMVPLRDTWVEAAGIVTGGTQ